MHKSVAEQLVTKLAEDKQTVAFCESLTAGKAAALLADVPGASWVLRGGLVTYATDTKVSLAGVSQETLDEHGIVSKETAKEMALGAKEVFGSDWAVSLTGVAGPEPQDGRPVGEVWIGFADPNGWADAIRAFPEEHHRWALRPGASQPEPVIDGDRNEIRDVAAEEALKTLLKIVEGVNQPGE